MDCTTSLGMMPFSGWQLTAEGLTLSPRLRGKREKEGRARAPVLVAKVAARRTRRVVRRF